jgi:ribosomal protein L37AE/L43A
MTQQNQPIYERESVTLIASGYEWECPECEELNGTFEVTEIVRCQKCGREFDVDNYEHAIE